MKATLKFDLPEEENEFNAALKGKKLAIAVWEFDSYLRNKVKYEDRNEFQEVRDKLWECLADNSITDEDLF